jgi:hypothetical protein
MTQRFDLPDTEARIGALRTLLDAEAGFDCETVEGFTNHRAMALQAMSRLGAPPARLRAWATAYERRLRPAPPWQPCSPVDAWAARFGQAAAWPVYRDLFRQWLDNESAGDVLQQVLPRLLQGVAGAAFHGVIRTAHAVAAAHRAELADALAYWASRWAAIGQAVPDATPTTADPEALLRQLVPVRVQSNFIMPGLRAAAAAPGFDPLAAQLTLDEHTVPTLAALAAKAYAASGHFNVLHLVTGALAVQELLAFVDPEDEAALAAGRGAFWRAFMATVAAAGIVLRPPVPARPWPALVAQALAQDDEHVLKLVDACLQWSRRAPAGPWQEAAARALAP